MKSLKYKCSQQCDQNGPEQWTLSWSPIGRHFLLGNISVEVTISQKYMKTFFYIVNMKAKPTQIVHQKLLSPEQGHRLV